MRKLGACTQEPCLSVSLYDCESKRTQQLERERGNCFGVNRDHLSVYMHRERESCFGVNRDHLSVYMHRGRGREKLGLRRSCVCVLVLW